MPTRVCVQKMIKIYYGNKLSGLKERASDMLCQSEGCHSLAEEAPTIIEQHKKRILKRISMFMTTSVDL